MKHKASVALLESAIYLLFIVAVLGGAFLMACRFAAERAAAYERVTGIKVTPREAMILDLRVEGSPTQKGATKP